MLCQPTPKRKQTSYNNFQFNKTIHIPCGSFAIPYPNHHQLPDNNGVGTTTFAILTPDEAKEFIQSKPLPIDNFINKLNKFPSVAIPTIDPSQYKDDIALSASICSSNNPSNSESNITNHDTYELIKEVGDFMNVEDDSRHILHYWRQSKDQMHVFKICCPELMVRILEYTFGRYHAPCDRTTGMGVNVYDGKVSR